MAKKTANQATAPAKFNFTAEGGMGGAVQLGKNVKKGEVLEVTGWVIGIKTLDKDYGKKGKPDIRFSHIIKLALPDGGTREIWGGGAINNVILEDGGTAKAKLKKEYKNVLTRFTFKGMLEPKDGKKAGRNIEVACDRSVKLPAAAGRINF